MGIDDTENTGLHEKTLESYAEKVIEDHPEDFIGVEVKGVRQFAGCSIVVDEVNPHFYTAYARHRDGRSLAIADAAYKHEVIDFGKKLVAEYADAYGWVFTE